MIVNGPIEGIAIELHGFLREYTALPRFHTHGTATGRNRRPAKKQP
jgi:hypothetical protein